MSEQLREELSLIAVMGYSDDPAVNANIARMAVERARAALAAYDAAPGPAVSEYRLSDKMQKLSDTVRRSSQWDVENDRMKAPAPWSPPPEAEREGGFKCSITVDATWTPCVSGGGWWVVTDADGVLRILDAKAPPPSPLARTEG